MRSICRRGCRRQRSGELQAEHGLDVREPLLEPRHILGAAQPAGQADRLGEGFLGIAVERVGATRRTSVLHLVVCGLGKLLEVAQMGFVHHDGQYRRSRPASRAQPPCSSPPDDRPPVLDVSTMQAAPGSAGRMRQAPVRDPSAACRSRRIERQRMQPGAPVATPARTSKTEEGTCPKRLCARSLEATVSRTGPGRNQPLVKAIRPRIMRPPTEAALLRGQNDR